MAGYYDEITGAYIDLGDDAPGYDLLDNTSGTLPDDFQWEFDPSLGYTPPSTTQTGEDILNAAGANADPDAISKLLGVAKSAFMTNGKLDLAKLLTLGGGALAMTKSNNRTQPSGYQGKIPTYTATRQAPGLGQMISGNVLFKKPDGTVVNPNSAAPSTGLGGLAELRRLGGLGGPANPIYEMDTPYAPSRPPREYDFPEANMRPVVNDGVDQSYAKGGALESGGFVIPADVVSHLGNGSSEAGLKLLAQRYGATPIKGKGDGMSDSIKTTIDGRQPARVANEEARLTAAQVKAAGGAKKLYAMMDKIRQARTGTKKQGKKINPGKFMPGGAVQGYATGGVPSYVDGGTTKLPTGTTGTESSLSNWAGDYVTDMLGKGKALAEMPYAQYQGPLTAGPSALQTAAFNRAGTLTTPASLGQAATTAGGLADAAKGMSYNPTGFSSQFNAPSAYQAGSFSNQFQAPTASAATQFSNQYAAPTPYATGSFGTDTFGTSQAQQYMNPYLSAALDPQLKELQRQNQIANLGTNAKLTAAGAYGGGRQAVMTAENQRNMMDLMDKTLGQGYSTAYDKATSQFNADQARNQAAQAATEQSRQFGANQSMTAAQLMAQYGLSAQQAQEAARQFNQSQAMTGAQASAQYGTDAQKAAEQSRQFGASQGLASAQSAAQYGTDAQKAAEQSKQFGASYGLDALKSGLQAAQLQGTLGVQENQANISNLDQLASMGNTQRGITSEGIAADKAQFEEARLNPYKMVQFQQSLLSGLPLTAQTYNQAPTDNLTQFANAATTIDKLLATLGQKP
jgi:hypothetical protein